MDYMDKILLNDKIWDIVKHENKNLFSLEDFNILPIWNDDENFFQYGIYAVEDYQLIMNHLSVSTDREYPKINGVSADVFYTSKNYSTGEYDNLQLPIDFTGAMVIGHNRVYEYDVNTTKCFDYAEVLELVFLKGKLVTTIDHTKAMKRIRKNIDLGLRDLKKKRDRRCIDNFLRSSFVGNYDVKHKNKRNRMHISLLGLKKD